MKKTITLMLALVVAMLVFATQAQAPQTGVYRIQNVGGEKYIKVTGKYDAQLVSSQSEASYITVGIEKKLSDGTYKVNSLYSTYDGGEVEVYSYLTKALTLGEIELRRELAGSSEPNVQRAIRTMHQLVEEYGFMRMMPVEGQADTYHAIAVLPNIPDSVEQVWQEKKNPNNDYVSEITHGTTMWDWCIDIVYRYLDEHSGEGGTNAALAAKIRNNLKNIKEGHTYMLTTDPDNSFGYIDVTGALTSDNNRSWWKLTPKVNTDNVKDGTYKIHNLGRDKWVRIVSKYYAKPDADEADASDIRITFDGEANGGQKIVNLGGKDPNGNDIDIYKYIEKAILIGKIAIKDVLTNGEGVDPANQENIEYAQQVMEEFVKENAFMSIKPVPDKDDAVYAYAYIPHIPGPVVTAMYNHHAIANDDEALAWAFGVQKVKDYLQAHSGEGGTDNTLATYILANIDNIQPGTTYYLSAHPSDGTFDYAAEGEFSTTDENFMWGFEVEDVEEDNLTSGTYKIRNVEYKNYVEVLSKYYAKPDTDEANATEIHITYNGKLDDGSYKVTNMSAVAKDGSMCDIQSYVDKAIKLGKIAIADVLKNMSDPEDIAYAQQYMEDFIRAAAFMRVKPVVGTNYVYAIATIPEIPYEVYHEMYRHGVILQETKEAAWDYGVEYVMSYLRTHGTNSTLAQLITNNINNIEQGHTYYLSEDANHTFGYVDAANFSADDKTIQWGIDIEEEDQPVESDFYKIHNVGNDLYVKVYDRYYAKPDVDEANATPIAVTIDGMLEDGSMKVTNLVGDGHDVQNYIAHAIDLGAALIHKLLDDVSLPENVDRAIEEMTNFVNENAYMRVKLVPGETDAYYAYVILPTVPQYIVDEWEKKYPNYNGTMRDWAVEQVLNYLDTHNTNSTLAAMVRANINRLYEGHTYYLRADGDNTFGFGDFTEGEVTLTDTHYWWGFADAIKAEPFSGYYRIKGADGKYVNVTGKFAATPNLDANGAKTAAGSVIYVGAGETKDTKTLPLEILRSQGVDVGDYMTMINDVLIVVADAASKIATQKLEENPNYSQYAGLVEPMVETLLESVDLNLYVEPTITTDGKDAYMLEVNIPDLAEYCDLALDALELMGKDKDDLVAKLQELEASSTGAMAKLYNIAWRTAQYLDNPDEMWDKLKENAKPYVQSYFIDGGYGPTVAQAGQFILNALNNPDFKHGTTYCLRQDADGTFGYASRESLADVDAGKWILEPFNEQDPNYDADTYIPFVVSADLDQEDYTSAGKPTGNVFYYTTAYFDFDAKIENSYAKAYTVTATDKKNVTKSDGTQAVVYLATLNPVSGNEIPAATPVVIKSQAEGELEIRPVNVPTHPAVESGELDEVKQQILSMIENKINGGTQNAPSPKVISTPTDGNLLVGSFFGDEIESVDANNYLELGKNDNTNGGLDMKGLGFWKADISKLDGNTAYLLGYDKDADSRLTDFDYGTGYASGKDGDAPGYVFQFEDETTTAIDNVTTGKAVKSVRYYNTLGVESETPFEGVNIIVTTYSDGSSSASKVIK